MKKFFATILLTLAIAFPALTVEAAYVTVPNFYNMAVNKYHERIRYEGTEHLSHNGVKYTSWNYTVCDGETSKYVNKYLKRLNSKHNINLVGQNGNDFYFAYSGGQAKYLTPFGGGFHIHVGVSGSSVVVDLVAGMYPEY